MRRVWAVLLCAGGLAAIPTTATPIAAGAGQCLAGRLRPVGTPTAAYAAVARATTAVYRRPRAALLATFPRLTELGYPTTFSVVGAIMTARCDASWIVRPSMTGSENGMPTSIASAPARATARTTSSQDAPSPPVT